VETPGNLKTSISNDKCAKGNNKGNEKNSKVSCKGGKLYKAQKLARGAGVNVGEYLCIPLPPPQAFPRPSKRRF